MGSSASIPSIVQTDDKVLIQQVADLCRQDPKRAQNIINKGLNLGNIQQQEQQAEEGGDFLKKRYDESCFQRLLEGKQRVMVLGMGGGCDLFMAYTFAKYLNHGTGTGSFIYANCISERKGGLPADHSVLVPSVLYAVPPGDPRPLVKNENTYGTTYIEQSVPRGYCQSPLLIEIKGYKGVTTEEQVKALTEENGLRVKQAFEYLDLDLVIGLDCGGDSLTGGKDYAVNPITGRDQQVLYAFRKYRTLPGKERFDFCHIVLGPGCDAETPINVMRKEVWSSPSEKNILGWCAGRKFLGSFPIEPLILDCFPLVQALEINRTPFLMYRALMDNEEFQLERLQPHEDGYESGAAQDLVKLSRHGNFELIPRSWLIHGLVFDYDRESDLLALESYP